MSQTITEEYRKLQQELHKNPNYGVASLEFAPYVASLMKQTGTRSLSDYGAGKQNLLRGLAAQGVKPEQYFPYDPAFPEYGQPHSADLVCCIDVLEHIEPDLVENVLAELAPSPRSSDSFLCTRGRPGRCSPTAGTRTSSRSPRHGGFRRW